MKKNRAYGILLVMAVSLATGCGAQMPELTDDEYALVAEYAAGALMKYNKLNEDRIVSDEEIAAQLAAEEQFRKNTEEYIALSRAKKEAESSDAEESASDGGTQTEGYAENADMAQVLGLEPLTITYTGAEVCDSYPQGGAEDFYFAMDATPGKKLIILKFDVANPSGADVPVDVLSSGTGFYVSFQGEGAVSILSTMLMNDLSTGNTVIPAGTSQEMVLALEADEAQAEADAMGSIQLMLRNAGGVARISLQ